MFILAHVSIVFDSRTYKALNLLFSHDTPPPSFPLEPLLSTKALPQEAPKAPPTPSLSTTRLDSIGKRVGSVSGGREPA